MSSSKYTAEFLGPIVASCRSLAQVLRKIGLKPTGGNYRYMNARIRIVGLDTSHFCRSSQHGWIDDLTREDLEPLIAQSLSVAQVLVQLGLPENGRPHMRLTKRLEQLGLDTSHFRGRGWSRGETKETHPTLARISQQSALPNEVVFVENSTTVNSRRLASRMVELGIEPSCAICGIVEWRGKPLVLHVDHINGINNDNRLENLRFLCPNCHSQTDTYCRRPSRAFECDGPYWTTSRAYDAPHVLYEGRSRAWRNWLTQHV